MGKLDDAYNRVFRFESLLRTTRGAFTSALGTIYDTDPGSELKPLGDAVRAFCDDLLTVMGAVDDAEDYRERLHDLVQIDGEERAIGGGPGFKDRRDKAWDRARERFEP